MNGAGRRRPGAGARHLLAALALGVAVVTLGWLLDIRLTAPDAGHALPRGADDAGDREFDRVFAAAVESMRQGRHRDAQTLWHRALLLDDRIVEVKVNLGFTLFDLARYGAAREMFIAAMEQNAFQANAYYGLAICSEKLGDLEGALGAMRSYIHLAAGVGDTRFLRRARAALWEWEAQLAVKSPADPVAGAAARPAR